MNNILAYTAVNRLSKEFHYGLLMDCCHSKGTDDFADSDIVYKAMKAAGKNDYVREFEPCFQDIINKYTNGKCTDAQFRQEAKRITQECGMPSGPSEMIEKMLKAAQQGKEYGVQIHALDKKGPIAHLYSMVTDLKGWNEKGIETIGQLKTALTEISKNPNSSLLAKERAESALSAMKDLRHLKDGLYLYEAPAQIIPDLQEERSGRNNKILALDIVNATGGRPANIFYGTGHAHGKNDLDEYLSKYSKGRSTGKIDIIPWRGADSNDDRMPSERSNVQIIIDTDPKKPGDQMAVLGVRGQKFGGESEVNRKNPYLDVSMLDLGSIIAPLIAQAVKTEAEGKTRP